MAVVSIPHPGKMLSWGLVRLLSVAAGLTVANIYYNQPAPSRVGQKLWRFRDVVGRIAVATQLGYACGLFLLVPLGDTYERRKLILGSAFGTSLVLLLVILSPTLGAILVAVFSSG